MQRKYTDLFKQLYENRYLQNCIPKNSLQRVHILQKKMRETASLRKHSKTNTSAEVPPFFANLTDLNDEHPKTMIRSTIASKKTHFNKNSLNQFYFSNPVEYGAQPHNSIASPRDINIRRNRSLTQRIKSSSPVKSLIAEKEPIKKQPYRDCLSFKSSEPCGPLASAHRNQTSRAMTPSRRVFIGDFNLQKQSQNFQRQFQISQKRQQECKREEKIKQIQQSPSLSASRARQRNLRSEKQVHIEIKKSQHRMRNKSIKHRNSEKEELIELLPWSVLAENQFY